MFLVLVLLAILAPSTMHCAEEEKLRNLTLISWAHAVNNKTYLDASLAGDIMMLEADIVMGHVKGQEGPQIPIMAHPPATTSDLTLETFLKTVAQHNSGKSDKLKGVKLDYKTIEAFENSQTIIAPYTKVGVKFPVWLNADILQGPVAATAVPVDPVKFLQLGAKHPRAVLSIGWTTNYGGKIIDGEYNREQIGRMSRLISENHVNQNVTFPVRAALASNSQPVLLDLLRETAYLNSTLTVWSTEGDHVEVDRLRALLLTVGLERTYLDIPMELATKLHLPEK